MPFEPSCVHALNHLETRWKRQLAVSFSCVRSQHLATTLVTCFPFFRFCIEPGSCFARGVSVCLCIACTSQKSAIQRLPRLPLERALARNLVNPSNNPYSIAPMFLSHRAYCISVGASAGCFAKHRARR